MKIIVCNIQRFCLHDGPGIRTTVFFKGCNLRCPWCANPENISFEMQEYSYNGEIGTYGTEMELKDLEIEILKDKTFFSTGGGVTFSGGEPLLQFENIEELLKSLKEKGINICVETALTVPEKLIDIATKYVDEFIIDMKILDKELIYKINGNTELYLKNLKKVFENNKNITIRIPLVPEYTVTDRNIEEILNVLNKYRPQKVQIFRIHTLSEMKYKTLKQDMPKFKDISDEEIEKIKKNLESKKINVEICKI